MKRNTGFTLVELLITMTIMVILLVLVVVNLRSNQANARDDQRKADITAIAQQLETYYEAGTPITDPGQYPGTNDVNTEAEITALLPDLNDKVLRAPDVASSSTMSFTVATTTTTPTPDINTFVYMPLTDSGGLCTAAGTTAPTECRKFSIYYALETVSGTQKITGKHQ
jgi:prepilin-type N-terminal cleavage/methylation domain-containing protein